MTDKQWKEIIHNAPKPINHEETWYVEHQCREMINSYLAYSCQGAKSPLYVYDYACRGSHKNYLEKYIKQLGKDRVIELIEEQINDIYCVLLNVMVDNEGLSYNSIVWVDEYDRIAQTKNLRNGIDYIK